jgi:hypothetical protein
LKGTALAYHAYAEPAHRGRGDSDLLVDPGDVGPARLALEHLGYSRDNDDEAHLQEVWSLESASYWHRIDLHWAAFNTRYLDEILPVDECFANSAKLPRLHRSARRLSDPYFLLHVCIHRNLHRTAPYFSGGKANFGADRLIWAKDIALLTGGFQASDWSEFIALAKSKEIAAAMEEALRFAHNAIGAKVPQDVFAQLNAPAASEPRSDYLLNADRRSRAMRNFMAIPGGAARLQHLRNLIAPPDDALRSRYPEWSGAPRFILLCRRLLDFAFGRVRQG